MVQAKKPWTEWKQFMRTALNQPVVLDSFSMALALLATQIGRESFPHTDMRNFKLCGMLVSLQFQFSLVAQSCLTLRPHEPQHARPPCSSPTLRVYPSSCPLSWWCHPAISSFVIPFSCPQSFTESGSFPMSHFFTSGGRSIGVSASTLVLPMNIQDWFPLGWTGWISLQSKGLSRVFSNTTVQ